MSTQSMVRAVITGASAAISTVHADRLGSTDIKTLQIHQAAKCWGEARSSDVPFRLALLLSDYLGDRPRRRKAWAGLLISIVNSLIAA
jgi:hypothetical protein